MTQETLFPMEPIRPRSPNGINVHRFLEGYGVKVLPYTEGRGWKDRPSNVVYGGRTIARLMRKDMDRAGLVVRCIQVSNPTCFDDVVIWAVWRVIEAHFAHRNPQEAIYSFRSIDISEVKKRATRLCMGSYGRMSKTWPVIAALMADAIVEKERSE